ncbi:MAG: gamma-glutamyltransferase [Pseudomonadota bacterium]
MTRVAVATSSELAADAATEIIEAGGNAVDAALAASLLTMNTEPGVCSLAGGALITVWPANDAPISFDGYVTVPGLDGGAQPVASESVTMAYGGGVTTTIGAGSVAVPGSPMAVEAARQRFGKLSLPQLLAPSIRAAREGFPLPSACHHYLGYSAKPVFGRDATTYQALHPDGESLLQAGDLLRLPGLDDTLQCLADNGIESLYGGELGDVIVEHLQSTGSRLSRKDLTAYSVDVRTSHVVDLVDWRIAVNPPPSIGGSMLAAILQGIEQGQTLLTMLRKSLQHRRGNLDFATDLTAATQRLLNVAAVEANRLGQHISAATVHTSAVDSDGLACAITASSGYGSGEVPPGTGLWLNNCLGELELNRRGLEAGPPGARLPSNMSPVAARNAQQVLAIGSPGADRITSALAQTLQRFLIDGESLHSAVEAPRVHVEAALESLATGYYPETLYCEPNARLGAHDIDSVQQFEHQSMFFGGVGAALLDNATSGPALSAAADSRRNGGTTIRRSTVR